ncbi:MAG: hypothetical protein AB8F94_21600 [Saprospiraceae bacterium]
MRSLLILIFCLGMTTVHAQKMSWRKHAKLAKKQFEENNFQDAAINFEAAWQKKPKKKEYIYQAAESYSKVKNYRKAAECYEPLKEENKDFEFPGLKYCRMLKMDGQYDEASRGFVYFINAYEGPDKDIVTNIVQDEIRGCELAMAMLEKENSKITFEHLSSNVNSKAADFAPVPFSDDVLYYTSNMVGETKMYLSQRNGEVWSRSRVPKNFPEIFAPHYGNGAFSPDNKSFFYTQCDQIDASGRMILGCEIFVTKRDENGWSAPHKLNKGINKTGATATQPFVVHQNGQEILYFVSDRSGGQGGMDIWFSTRDLASEKLDYDRPRNCGKVINSMADEMTPYFDMSENTMYFSSNGKVNIGGFDVFKSKGTGDNEWAKSENIGLPINSNADDYYYRKHSANGGYVVSNRKFGLEKTTYSHDDIFSFSTPVEKMMASGKVVDKKTNHTMKDVWVAIYEVSSSGTVRLLENKASINGTYEFGLLPEKNYRIEAHRDGYEPNGWEFNTMEKNQMVFENDIMIGETKLTNNTPTSPATTTTESGSTASTTGNTNSNGTFNNPQPAVNIEGETYGSDSGSVTINNPAPKPEVNNNTSTSPTPTIIIGEESVVYKIQLMAVRKYNSNETRYQLPKNYGTLETEYLGGKNLTRVLLSNFSTKEEAERILDTMKSESRDFKSAVIVRYENGVRIDPWAK